MSQQSSQRKLYRVSFFNQGRVYELYARSVSQGGLYGFVEIEALEFGERSRVVVDPSEEKLAAEFENVERTYVPMHAIIRIDEVSKGGPSKVRDVDADSGKVMPFPVYTNRNGDQ